MNETARIYLIINILLLILSGCQKGDSPVQFGSVTDADGNIYKTVVIGSQTWMAENLKVNHYRNGDSIDYLTGDSQWSASYHGAYCWYENDESQYKDLYGALYNYRAVLDIRGISPEGWRIATQSDWNKLSSVIGGNKIAGGRLKEIGTAHWYDPNVGATDEFKFNCLPGGQRSYGGPFEYVRQSGMFWTTTQAYFFLMSFETDALITNQIEQNSGLSVRCIKIVE